MESKPLRLGWRLAAFTVTRLIVSTANRMVYPFLPEIARGLGVTLKQATLAVTARSALGLAGPLLGSIADARGRKPAMIFGLGIFATGMLVVGLWPTYLMLFVGLILSGAGNIIVDSAIYAVVGDQVPYERRGLAIAVIEIGWSAAFVVGIPIIGWLIARRGWSAPFPWLAIAGLAAGGLLLRILPRDATPLQGQTSLRTGLRLVLTQAPAVAGLAVSLLILTANQSVNIVYGAWMEDAFGLRVEELGAASVVIGLAGIVGVALTAVLSDTLGKRRAVGLGISVNTMACLALPWLGTHLPGALISLFLFYVSFEFALTSAIPLLTELVPGARATMMAGNVAAIAAGDALGAFVGPLLFSVGLSANSALTASLNLVALLLLISFVRTRESL